MVTLKTMKHIHVLTLLERYTSREELNVTATVLKTTGPNHGFKMEAASSSFSRKAVQAALNPHFSSD
jgi:hypothetical protein